LKKKGWITEEDETAAEESLDNVSPADGSYSNSSKVSQKGVKLVLEIATAWALVKMALPVRIAASVGLTPWFAKRFVVPISQIFRRSRT
jgi:hypothetical protein